MLHFHSLEIAEVRKETGDAVVVTFHVPDELRDEYRFVQGQHIAVRRDFAGKEVRRTYSICAGAGEDVLRVAIKHVDDGLFSSYANRELQAGDRLDVLTPTGRFHTPLDPAQAKLYVAFAAGSGITPILSLISTTLACEPASRFVLFYGNRNRPSIMFREELEDIKNRYIGRFSVHHVLSRQKRDLDLYNGRLDGDKCRVLCKGLLRVGEVDTFFLCGPSTMIDDLSEALRDLGVDPARIHFERFATAASRRMRAAAPVRREHDATDAPACRVSVILDGVRSEFAMAESGQTVLDAATEQGFDLPFSCKSGVCTTCRGLLREGQVRMEANYGLEAHEVEAGFILTCQSHPRSARLIIDFDAA